MAEEAKATGRAIPIVSIIGRSRSGKTTLIEKLIPELKRRGYRVATIKHHAHPGFEIDFAGKDSWRHAQAGSDHVVIAAPDRIASIRRLERQLSLDEVAAGISDVDIIITDGYRSAGKPAIAVLRAEDDVSPATLPAPVFAVVSDAPLTPGLPRFDWNDAPAIVDMLEQRFLKQAGDAR